MKTARITTTHQQAEELLEKCFAFDVTNIDSEHDRISFAFTSEKFNNDQTDGHVDFFADEASVPQILIDFCN
jgi:hypothetical protein